MSTELNKFDNRIEMMKYYCNLIDSPVLLEIGVFRGDFLASIIQHCSIQSIEAVDLFEGETCSGDSDGNNVTYYNVGQSFLELSEKYKESSIVKLYASDSCTYLEKQPSQKYDIIYLDGDHSYEGVKKDLRSAYLKIKDGGYLMGHDYEMNKEKAKNHYEFGVKQAVDEFCQQYHQNIIAKAMDGCVSYCIQIHHRHLIYTTIGYSIKWFDIILLLLDSIEKYTTCKKSFDFLIICDDNMYDEISIYLQNHQTRFSFTIMLHNIRKNSSQPDFASMNKLSIYDFSEIHNYSKILFVDGDIICTFDLNRIWVHELADNVLYVYKEQNDINQHNHIYWGLQNYTSEELESFSLHSIYPFNCGLFLFMNTPEMKKDFDSIIAFISSYKGKFFYEQSFMNYYFNRKGNVNYDILTRDNYIMFPDENVHYADHIIHFATANCQNKLSRIQNYIARHGI